jgi:hypothetical protein
LRRFIFCELRRSNLPMARTLPTRKLVVKAPFARDLRKGA